VPPDLPGLHHESARSDPFAWAGLAVVVGSAYLVSRLVTWLSMSVALRRWRRSGEASWVERARLAWPARRLGRVAWLVIAIPLMFAVSRGGRGGDLLPPVAMNLLIAAASLFGGNQSVIDWGRRLNPTWAMTPRPARGAWVFSLALIGPVIVLGFVLYALAPERWDSRSWALLACGSAAAGGHMAWGWLRVMRWTGTIRPAGDRFRTIASQSAARAGIALRSIEEAAIPMANGLAFVHDRSVGATDALLAILDDDELAAVCAHELGHLGEPGWVRAIRLSFGVLFGLYLSALVVMMPAMRSLPLTIVLWVPVGSMLALLFAWSLFLRLVHRMEIRADVQASRPDTAPGAYARALEKIYAANLVPVVLGTKRRTHPDLYDRLVAAGATPEYPRPQAPPHGLWWSGFLVLVLGAAAGFLAVDWLAAALL
jgi:Zn-dependent protease with chaperone function